MTGKILGTGASAAQPLEIKRAAGGARIRQPMLLPPSSANRLLPSSETARAAPSRQPAAARSSQPEIADYFRCTGPRCSGQTGEAVTWTSSMNQPRQAFDLRSTVSRAKRRQTRSAVEEAGGRVAVATIMALVLRTYGQHLARSTLISLAMNVGAGVDGEWVTKKDFILKTP